MKAMLIRPLPTEPIRVERTSGRAVAIMRLAQDAPVIRIAGIIPGPPGPAGTSLVSSVAAVAAEDVAIGQPLTIDRGTNQLRVADPSFKPLAFVVGLAIEGALAGFVATAQGGQMSMPDWTAVAGAAALTPGAPYFLTPGGTISSSPPLPPSCLTIVGTAVSPTTLNVDPLPPIQL